jgi:hypothetical protein
MTTQFLGQEAVETLRADNPAYRLREVDQTAPAGMWTMDAQAGDLLFQAATAADWSAYTTVVTLASTPAVTIHGTLTVSGAIVFSANVRLDDDIVVLFGDGSDYYLGYSATDDLLEIGTGSTIASNVAFSVDSSGQVGIGGATHAADRILTLAAAVPIMGFQNASGVEKVLIYVVNEGTDGGSFRVQVKGDGGGLADVFAIAQDGGIFFPKINAAAAGTAVSITGNELHTDASSARYKDNVGALDVDSGLIYELAPRSFDWNDSSGSAGKHDFGLIAEEVAEVLPALVNYDDQARPISLRNSLLPHLLIEELKKLRGKVTALEAAVGQ